MGFTAPVGFVIVAGLAGNTGTGFTDPVGFVVATGFPTGIGFTDPVGFVVARSFPTGLGFTGPVGFVVPAGVVAAFSDAFGAAAGALAAGAAGVDVGFLPKLNNICKLDCLLAGAIKPDTTP